MLVQFKKLFCKTCNKQRLHELPAVFELAKCVICNYVRENKDTEDNEEIVVERFID